MASSVIRNPNVVSQISVPSGFSLYKYGRIAELTIAPNNIQGQSEGWIPLLTLPQEARPIVVIFFTSYDNTNRDVVIESRILNSGEVDIYLYADRLSVSPRSIITYICRD